LRLCTNDHQLRGNQTTCVHCGSPTYETNGKPVSSHLQQAHRVNVSADESIETPIDAALAKVRGFRTVDRSRSTAASGAGATNGPRSAAQVNGHHSGQGFGDGFDVLQSGEYQTPRRSRRSGFLLKKGFPIALLILIAATSTYYIAQSQNGIWSSGNQTTVNPLYQAAYECGFLEYGRTGTAPHGVSVLFFEEEHHMSPGEWVSHLSIETERMFQTPAHFDVIKCVIAETGGIVLRTWSEIEEAGTACWLGEDEGFYFMMTTPRLFTDIYDEETPTTMIAMFYGPDFVQKARTGEVDCDYIV